MRFTWKDWCCLQFIHWCWSWCRTCVGNWYL